MGSERRAAAVRAARLKRDSHDKRAEGGEGSACSGCRVCQSVWLCGCSAYASSASSPRSNGVGKSTLLKVMGERTLIGFPPHLRVCYGEGRSSLPPAARAVLAAVWGAQSAAGWSACALLGGAQPPGKAAECGADPDMNKHLRRVSNAEARAGVLNSARALRATHPKVRPTAPPRPPRAVAQEAAASDEATVLEAVLSVDPQGAALDK